MNTCKQIDHWTYRTTIVLGFTVVATVIGIAILTIMRQPMSELLICLGTIAAAGLLKLLISPLNRELFG